MSEETEFKYNPAGRLQGRVAFVSGAGSVGPGWGNGRAIAVRFAEEGALVFATDRDPARLVETAERVAAAGGTLVTCECDVTDSASLAAAVARPAQRSQRLQPTATVGHPLSRDKFLQETTANRKKHSCQS